MGGVLFVTILVGGIGFGVFEALHALGVSFPANRGVVEVLGILALFLVVAVWLVVAKLVRSVESWWQRRSHGVRG